MDVLDSLNIRSKFVAPIEQLTNKNEMLSTAMNSSEVSQSIEKPLQIDTPERISSLHSSLLNQLESVPEVTSSVEQTLRLIPMIFRYLQKNVQSQEQLFQEYNHISDSIQNVVSICAQYIHDRHGHEKELLFFKNRISQIIGQIGYSQYRLEQYGTIISCLEQESDRLQILLRNPQILQNNQQKFQVLQDSQKIKLDRFLKDNEKMQFSITKQKESIQTIQQHIEVDLKELQGLKAMMDNLNLEQQSVREHRTQLEKQSVQLRTIHEQTKEMENEYIDRIRATKVQYGLVQKQCNTLINTYNQAKEKLSAIQTNELNIKEEIDRVKNEIHTEQSRSIDDRDQIQTRRHQTDQLVLAKRQADRTLKSAEHLNLTLERQRSTLTHHQLKFRDRIRRLTEQLTDLNKENQTSARTISTNVIHLNNHQRQIRTIEIALKKIRHLNNNLEKVLKENRSIRLSEEEKLRSIQKVTFEKRKQFILQTKRLQTLSIAERRLTHRTVRYTFEIVQLHEVFDDLNRTEKRVQQSLQKNKTEMMKQEKRRASLSGYLQERNSQLDFLTKKNQLVENELRTKIELFRLLHANHQKQKHDQTLLSNQKQTAIDRYQQRHEQMNQSNREYQQLERFSDHQANDIVRKREENDQLQFNIGEIQQDILSMIGRHKRQLDECSLLKEKIRLYTQLNDVHNQEQQRCSFHLHHFCRAIVNLRGENERLVRNVQDSRRNTMLTLSSHRDNILKKENLHRTNQILSSRPFLVRESAMRIHTQRSMRNYPTFVERLLKMIHQCVQWREELLWLDQLYFTKIEQLHQQTRALSANNKIIVRYKINSELKQCQARKAELRLQTL